MIYWIISS